MGSAEQLAELVTRLERRPSPVDMQSFPFLYRASIAELAEARARGRPARELYRLEAALVAAHGLLYAPRRMPLGRSLAELLRSLPRATRAAARSVLAAALLVVMGAAWGYFEVRRDPASAVSLLGYTWVDNAEGFKAERMQSAGHPLLGVFYFTHNAAVAFNAFAMGVTFGIGTVLGLLYNGIILGGTIAVVRDVASPRALLAFILPHGGVELTAIVIAAAGGLEMGAALIDPGWKSRASALTSAARRAIPLAIGTMFLLAVAGLLEGWVSPSRLPMAAKAVIGLSLDAALLMYLVGVGREPSSSRRRISEPARSRTS
jgi:uncharacterized membrane protein SpoIIM required for sporulation